MSTLFPFLPLMPEESVTSYAARITALHHGGSVRAFLRWFGMPYAPIVAGDPDALAAFAKLTAVPSDDIARAALTTSGHISCFRGELVQQRMLRHAQTYICPRCLDEDITTSSRPPLTAVYGRMIWQFSPIQACPRHHVLLEPIGDAGHGDKAHDFARAVTAALPTMKIRAAAAQAVKPSAAEGYLVARFSTMPIPSPLLDAMPWYAAARTCEAVGIAALHGAHAGLRGRSVAVRREAADHGFHILHGGEGSVRSFLDDLRGKRTTWKPEYDGARACYGKLHDVLTLRPDPAYVPLRRIVHEHAIQTIPYGVGDSVVGLPVTRRHVHSIATAAAETGQHPKRLRKILIAEGLVAPDAQRKDSAVLFDAVAAAPCLRRMAKGVRLRGVTAHLRTRYAHTLTLIRGGFIKPFVTHAVERQGQRATYAVADLDDFLASLTHRAVVHAKPQSPVMDIPQAAKRAYCTMPDVLQMILDGTLSWVGLDPETPGFHGIVVNADEILERVRAPDLDGFTAHALKARLGIHQRAIEGLIAWGYLRRERRINPVNRCPVFIVRPDTVEAFEREYVSLWELSKRYNTNAYKLKVDLDRRGKRPAISNDKVGATFYLRRLML